MERDLDAAIRELNATTKPKELHAELDEYDPYDHEAMANDLG